MSDDQRSAVAQVLEGFRKRLEFGWSARTVHPDFAGAPKGSPKGQCGVTSVWLARELRSFYKIECTYCYGELRSGNGGFEAISRHCWIEVGADGDPERHVIDLTADQAKGFRNGVRAVLGAFHDGNPPGLR